VRFFDEPAEPRGFGKHVLETRKTLPVNANLVEASERYGSYSPQGEVPKSVVFVPLVTGVKVTGAISLQNIDLEHAFSDSDVPVLETLARIITSERCARRGMQAVNVGSLSSLHLKVLGSVAVKLALVDAVGLAGLDACLIVVSGGPVSTVHVKLVVVERLPAASRARRLKVCVPCRRPVNAFVPAGPVPQAAKTALSTRQEYAADSLVVHLNVAVVEVSIASGVAVSATVGGTVSVVQVKLAGVASMLPAASMPRAWNVCVPSARLESAIEIGGVQAVKAVIEAALQRRVRVRCNREGGSRVVRIGRRRREGRVGGDGVDRPAEGRRRRIAVAGVVGRRDAEGVLAL
jgi:hypothetical protein